MMAIDPGISGTGVAFFNGKKLEGASNVYSKEKTWQEKALTITAAVETKMVEYSPQAIWIEFPEPMRGSSKTIASRDKGDTLKLACLVGMMMAVSSPEMQLVKPSKWKGQLSKQIVEQRVREWLIGRTSYVNLVKIKSHSWDAIGIALWAMGEF